MTSARAMEIRDRLAAEAERRRRVRRDRIAALPDEPLAWHIGRCAPGRDFAVERGLIDAGWVAYAPRETVTVGDRLRRRDVDWPLFPGYVFFAMPPVAASVGAPERADGGRVTVRLRCDATATMAALSGLIEAERVERAARPALADRWLLGVEGLKGALADADGAWRVAPDAAVRFFMRAEALGRFDRGDAARAARNRQALRRGDSVLILDGPMRDAVAIVREVRQDNRLKLLVKFLGGERVAEARLDSVRKMASA